MPESLIPLGLAKNWIAKLWNQWSTLRSERRQELLEIEREFVSLEQLELLAKLYIEPECQATNPADHDEDEPERAVRQPIHKWINGFLKGTFRQQDGRNMVFVLSDAGMGKSSLLMMLKLSHLSRFWPEEREFKLLKLGSKTLEAIDQLGDRGKTVLLLDALDEDPTAWGRIEERLAELLAATKSFRQVILTCRTQFFPKGGEAAIEKPWKIEVGGYICNLIYLSPFSDEQVEEYLRKVFPDGWRERLAWLTRQEEPEARGRARRAVRTMRSLRMRPMLLAHVHDLMEEDVDEWTEYRVYRTLIERWLLREQRKQKGKVTQGELLQACIAVALHLQAAGKRELTLQELHELVEAEPLAERLDGFDFGGRSLLNRTSEQGFRFAHYSIQEFLLAQALVSDGSRALEGQLRATDQLVAFLISWLNEKPAQRFAQVPWSRIDFGDIEIDLVSLLPEDLVGANLRGVPLYGADLRGRDLQWVDLRGADLRFADLRDADLSFGRFARATLTGARLDGATLEGAGFLGCVGLEVWLPPTVGAPAPSALRDVSQRVGQVAVQIAWHPNGRALAACMDNGQVAIWDSRTGHVLQRLQAPEAMCCLAWRPDGARLATGSDQGTLRIWRTGSGDLRLAKRSHRDRIHAVGWSPHGVQIATSSEDSRVCIRDAGTGKLRHFLEGHTDPVYAVAWSRDGKRLVSGSEDSTVRIWNPLTNELLATWRIHREAMRAVAVSPTDDRFAVAFDDGTVRIFSSSDSSIQTLKGHTTWVGALAWSPTSARLASGDDRGSVKLWELSSGESTIGFRASELGIRSLAWDNTGRRLAAASYASAIKIWGPRSFATPLQVLEPGEGELQADGWALYEPEDLGED